ncbi:hypothetical protein GGR20_000904 [Devosia subaequoris]|uniref:Glycosyltransferase family 4 protein n=1 Tax=Devosia subaequoris TaxID=395930 RepID=A0A7W6IKH0_9HYPH|nr:hypothetical protein [Devosia subaequoris]MBB4051286.1 hypothetical protein [Devosia subaequoris]MCP1211415.1 hypothetical protein [Devosia subaequoris]
MLFLRVGTYLAHDLGMDVTLIDYADGFMAKNLKSDRVKLVTYSDDGRTQVPTGAVLVLQSMNPWSIFPGLDVAPGTRLVFWNCLPFNLVPALPGVREISYRLPALLTASLRTALAGRRAINKRLVEAMYARHAIFFMDEENVSATRRFLGAKIDDPIYLPIPVASPPAKLVPPRKHGADDTLRLVWVGRIADFKHTIIARAITDTEDYCRRTGARVELTIVGSGPYLSLLQAHATTIKHVTLEFIDSVAPDQLDAFLSERADIVLAMGTAALDGARLGIPTILLDPSYGPVANVYRYRWLFEERGFTLGRILFGARSYPPGRALDVLLEAYGHNAHDLAERTAAYVQTNHAMPVVATKLVTNLENATYRWGDLSDSGANRRDWIYRVFTYCRKLLGRGC